MKTLSLLCFLITSPMWAMASLNDSKNEGEKCGKESAAFAFDQVTSFSTDGLMKPGEKIFDADSATEQVKNEDIPETDVVKFLQSEEVQRNQRENKHFSTDEYFLTHSEAIASNTESFKSQDMEETVLEFSYEKCQEAAAPYPISFTRDLHLDVVYEPEQKKTVKICRGHKKKKHYYWKSDAKKWVKKQLRKFSKDKTLKEYDAFIDGDGEGVTDEYRVRAVWRHLDDASTCDDYRKGVKIIQKERWEEKNEKWIYSDESLFNLSRSPDCVLIEKACLDASPKDMNGKEIQKQCWKEKLEFLCHFPKTKQCNLIKERNCQEAHRKCLQESPYGCALWEVTYKCFDTKIRKKTQQNGDEIFGLNQDNWKTDFVPNNSFPDVYTKLSLFKEIKKELEAQNIKDATQIQIFKGKEMTCSKNIAADLIYDCCFSFGGFTTDIKLSQCSEKELSLGEMREKGLCHYIGKYEEKFIDLWKSCDVHVYCCFPSKLARVFQEESRTQLNIGWGEPKDPICRGLYPDEIAKVDFTMIDLSEIYDKHSQELENRLQEKMKSVTGHLKERLESEKKNATT